MTYVLLLLSYWWVVYLKLSYQLIEKELILWFLKIGKNNMIYRITTLILLAFAILFFALHWTNLVESVTGEFTQPNLRKNIKSESIASLPLNNDKYNPIFENKYYSVEDGRNTEIKQKKIEVYKLDKDTKAESNVIKNPLALDKKTMIYEDPRLKDTWKKNSVQIGEVTSSPKIAIVIDDAGVDKKRTAAVIQLQPPVTIAFLTYASEIKKQVRNAKKAGHEIIVHMAMEPESKNIDPGPNVLLIKSDSKEILDQLRWGLNRFDGYVGINNHMGSRFTSDPNGMGVVMRELKRRGLLFLDSRTSRNTVGASIALAYDVPYTQRDFFLDNDDSLGAINRQLRKIESFAKKNGYAVAIGHPKDSTLKALSQWLKTLKERGFSQVPISQLVKVQNNSFSPN